MILTDVAMSANISVTDAINLPTTFCFIVRQSRQVASGHMGQIFENGTEWENTREVER